MLGIIAEPLTPCAVWRIQWPFGELTTHGYVADSVMSSNSAIERMLEIDRYNTIITPRFVFESPEGFAERMRSSGKRWVFETDDDLVSPSSIRRQMTHDPRNIDIESKLENNRQLALRTLKLVDLVTVSSEPLAEAMRDYTDKPVVVIPNYLNLEVFRAGLEGKERIVPPLTIGWAGGVRDDTDLEPLIAAWPIVAERYPDVHFVVAGYECRPLIECLPPSRVTFIQGVSFDDYPALLLNIDIMCCCVSSSRWNENKTAVKWMEASVAGAACVVSGALYGRYVHGGQNALVVSEIEDWVAALALLIERPELRNTLVREAQKTIVQQHSLKANWQRWLEAYGLNR